MGSLRFVDEVDNWARELEFITVTRPDQEVDALAREFARWAGMQLWAGHGVDTKAMKTSIYVISPKRDEYQEKADAGVAIMVAAGRASNARVVGPVTRPDPRSAVVGVAMFYSFFYHEGHAFVGGEGHHEPRPFFVVAARIMEARA